MISRVKHSESKAETLYRIDSQSLLQSDGHGYSFEYVQRLACHFENPILTLFTNVNTAVFLDQRSLVMSKYEIESEEAKTEEGEVQMMKQLTCQDCQYIKNGTVLVCLFDQNLLQVFRFLDSSGEKRSAEGQKEVSAFQEVRQEDGRNFFDLNQIVSIQAQGPEKVPDSGTICMLQRNEEQDRDSYDYLALFSHYGESKLLNRRNLELMSNS